MNPVSGDGDETRSLGAYGLRLPGLASAARWLVPQAADAPLLQLAQEPTEPDDSPSVLELDHADLRLLDGARLRAQRRNHRFTLCVPQPLSRDQLVHPYLAPAAALFWQWAGAEALHAGVLGTEKGAVLLFGQKESGKSTTLALLSSEHACPILSDDLAVITDGQVLAGPRSLDLRPGSANGQVTRVRHGERLRMDLGSAPASLPVAGSVILEWGTQLAVEPVDPRARLAVLSAQRTYPLKGDPVALLELSALPMFRVERVRDATGAQKSAEVILECFS
jgi:hypothetical protein